MNDIGIEKEIDNLGRIYIPIELRRLYNFDSKVALIATKEGILIKNPEYVLIKIEKSDLNKKAP